MRRREELRMSIHFGRGYGRAWYSIRDKPASEAMKEAEDVLVEKYGYAHRGWGRSRLVRRRRA